MGKLLNNLYGVAKACIYSGFVKNVKIGKGCRFFPGSSMNFYSGTNCIIGNKVKVNRNATVSSHKNASLKIGDSAAIGINNAIVCLNKIDIGSGTIMGPNVCIYDHDHIYNVDCGVNPKDYNVGEVVIGKNCWIAANVVILRNTQIGDNCVIGAGSVIKGKIPSGSVVVQKRDTQTIGK